MPAVLIRQLENLLKVAAALGPAADRGFLLRHADMLLRSSVDSVPSRPIASTSVAYDR